VGAKARGLLWLPSAWVPPFFVLSRDFHAQFIASSSGEKKRLIHDWAHLLEQGVRLSGLNVAGTLHLRSNAVSETITERGKYQSLICQRHQWLGELRTFFEKAAKIDATEPIGVVIQRYIEPLVSGHLSNARRVAEEYRDAVIELIEEASGQMTEERLSFRRWRRPKAASSDALSCRRREELLPVLREPLAYAAGKKKRVHFEWLWDGRFVYVVQADQASERQSGVSPESLLAGPQDTGSPKSLQVFRAADRKDTEHSKKLRNHFLYADNGFRQPPFYLLTESAVIRELLAGTVRTHLLSDLGTLTKRPLVIRTSSTSATGALLPRSDLLRSANDAGAWLTGAFAQEINRTQLPPEGLTLIAHHFVPALGAAFSTASPDKRRVYIEALWGIPEGLYYYPCDAYLIDTQVLSANDLREQSKDGFQIWEERRFKGEFVAPNKEGKFVVHTTLQPWDWKGTVADDSVARDIALFTRRLAAIEGKPVKLMWFLGCPSWTGLPSALPWYHDFEADDWTTAGSNYQRNSRDEIVSLSTLNDLEKLEQKALKSYKPSNARRLVIRLNPVEDLIIRNQAVAERIGKAACGLGAIVELQGGVLSHLYYVLRRTGADVAVRNRPSFSVPPAAIQKLVRDKIPHVVAAGGEVAKISHLAPEELVAALKIKLVEEAFEARDAAASDLVHELADVLEVVDALTEVSQISRKELQKVRQMKRARRGGFKRGVVLLETSLMLGDSSSASPTQSMFPLPEDGAQGRVVETSRSIPLEDTRPGPFDIRNGVDFVEFVHTGVVGLTHPEWSLKSPERIRVDARAPADSIAWSLEGKREGGQIKLRVKIRLGTVQMSLPLEPKSANKIGTDDG
jgi:predicted house-cleaning noncanonical NTP pyrophosphatase (MazG superfamily)